MAEVPLSLTELSGDEGPEERERSEQTLPAAPSQDIAAIVRGELARAQAEWAEQLRQTQDELRTEKARWQDVRRAMTGKPDDTADPDTVFFRSPTEQLQALRQDITRELRAEYQAEQKRASFWRGFYDENPELEGLQEFVDITMARHPELADMPVSKGSEVLAQKTREMVLQATQKVRRATGSGNEVQFERGGRRRGRQEEPEEAPTSLAAELKLLKGGQAS